jgi:putative ABC transport system permease protein
MADYFKTLQVNVIYGREFASSDTVASRPVAVVNQTMAQRFWPNENPLGKYVRIESAMLPNEPIREIVGVVSEVQQYTGQQDRSQLYLPYLQLSARHDERLTNDLRRLTFIVRTTRTAAEIAPALRSAVNLADSGQAVGSVRTMRDTAFNNQRRRVFAGLIGTFAVVAVLLAAIGVYGVMAQVVSQRTNEIGIRMALGANSRQVRHLVIRQGGLLIGVGVVRGNAGALALTRVLQSQLYGLTATDPFTIISSAVLLGVIGLLACYVPARRASRIDPMLALRHE